MRPFIFSADSHITEPADLFLNALPAHLQEWALHQNIEGRFRIAMIGENRMLKIAMDIHSHKTGEVADDHERRRGARDLSLRLADMDRDGVDAELCFPSLALMAQRIENREAAVETARIYNDWAWEYTAAVRERLIPAAIIPILNLEDALAELERIVAKGYRGAMLPPALPDGPPRYNDPAWDPIFALAGKAGVPLIFHTGTGVVNLRALRGPGGALFNYTRQINDAIDVTSALVGSGILDRNPDARILFVEHSAGWLMGVAQRMDEVYIGHSPYITPKLSRMPSQIVRDQVRVTFQNDVGCLLTRKVVGLNALIFATDYPHAEGTFPYSRELIEHMFDDVPDMSDEDRRAVLGLNAARLFGLDHIADRVSAAA